MTEHMEKIMRKYTINIRYEDGETEETVIRTTNIDWSMEQYQRNRQPFTWRVVEKNLPKSLKDKMQGK